MRDEDDAAFDATGIRAMHYMMLSHDQAKSPGRYRKGPVNVRDERRDEIVYEGPDALTVPSLMDALVVSLHSGVSLDPLVLGHGSPQSRDDPSVPRRQRLHGPSAGNVHARVQPPRSPHAGADGGTTGRRSCDHLG
jgi:hypothetical protein